MIQHEWYGMYCVSDIFGWQLLSTPVELGGPGVIVQIDESF
jgi:hypothetical protein